MSDKLSELQHALGPGINLTYLAETLEGEITEVKKGKHGFVLLLDYGIHRMPRYGAFKTARPSDLPAFWGEVRAWHRLRGYPLFAAPTRITLHQGHPFVQMAQYQEPLRTYLERSVPLPKEEVLYFGALILRALLVLGQRGFQNHQDLTPGNILLGRAGLPSGFAWNGEGLSECVNLRPLLSDFGLMDRFRSAEGESVAYGSQPYMAPEQFNPSAFGSYNPDVFAVGVLLHEMATGVHPCGRKTSERSKSWNRSRWQKWANEGSKTLHIDESDRGKVLSALIQDMLKPDPLDRLSVNEALKRTLDLLREENPAIYALVTYAFEYFDAVAWDYTGFRLQDWPRWLDFVIESLSRERENADALATDAEGCVRYLRISSYLGRALSRRSLAADKVEVLGLAMEMIRRAISYRHEIRSWHVYPPVVVRGRTLDGTKFDVLTSEEAYRTVVGWGKDLLEWAAGKEAVGELRRNADPMTASVLG